MFVMPSLVLEETGMSRNFMPSLSMACIMLRLKRRLVPSSFVSMASSSSRGLADHDAIDCTSFFGSKSVFESTCNCGWKKRL